jgi:hypothetical protein
MGSSATASVVLVALVALAEAFSEEVLAAVALEAVVALAETTASEALPTRQRCGATSVMGAGGGVCGRWVHHHHAAPRPQATKRRKISVRMGIL